MNQMITIKSVTCNECSATVNDVLSIKSNPVVGAYFTCEYCGALNIVNIRKLSISAVEQVTKQSFPSSPTVDQIKRWSSDANILNISSPRAVAPLNTVIWKDRIGIDRHIWFYPKPTIIIDLDHWFDGMKDPKNYVIAPPVHKHLFGSVKDSDVSVNVEWLASVLITLLKQIDSFGSVVVAGWDNLRKSIESQSREIEGMDRLSIYGYAYRNEVLEWLVERLNELRNESKIVEIFVGKRVGWDGKEIIEVPKELRYTSNEVLIFAGGSSRTMQKNEMMEKVIEI